MVTGDGSWLGERNGGVFGMTGGRGGESRAVWLVRMMTRAVARATVAAVLLVVLVGTPMAGIRLVDVGLRDGWSLRDLVSTRRVDDRVVVAIGVGVFVVLWAWFAMTALAEVWVSMRWRLSGGRRDLAPVADGSLRWLRLLVRFVVVSGAVAGLAVSVAAPGVAGADGAAVDAAMTVQVDVPDGVAASDVDERAAPSLVVRSGGPGSLVGAVMFAAGALALLEASRRRRLRSSVTGARLEPPSLEQVRAEMALRSLDAQERMVRLDVALRAVAPALAATGAQPTVVLIDERGSVRVLPSSRVVPDPASAEGALCHLDPGGAWWCLAGALPLERLAALSRSDAPPCPALLHLGATDLGECFVDLEALGVLTVASDAHREALEVAVATLRVSPFIAASRVLAVGSGSAHPAAAGGIGGDSEMDTLDAALDAAAGLLGATVDAVQGTSTFERRVATRGGEAWEPCIVAVDGCAADDAAMLRRLVRPGAGLAVIAGTRPDASDVGRPHEQMDDAAIAAGGGGVVGSISDGTPGSDGSWWLVADPRRSGRHLLLPAGLSVQLARVDRPVLREVTRLLVAEREPLPVEAPVVSIDIARGVPTPFVEPDWQLMVRLLGGVDVVSADGQVAAFEKSKALELVAWLVLHRRRPTRSAARAALWDVEVKDATFANVVSEARRALAAAAGGGVDEWIARTLTDALPLHDGVVSDADVLGARVRHAAGLSHRDAIEVLTPGVELIGGMPFAGTGYLWCDAEGHASSLVLLAVDAAAQLAAHHLAVGDVDGVFWATGRGLSILNGHEELIALRMRAHAGRGDLAGVRGEWERYERSLLADPWAAAEPSPKLAMLRRELLSFGESRVRGSNS